MSTLLTKLSIFGAKVETTPGTAETLTGSHTGFNVYDLEINPDLGFEDRDAIIGFGSQASVPSDYKGTAKFKLDLAFNGTTIPNWATVLLPGCGVYNTSGVFAPKTQTPDTASAVVKCLTIGQWNNGTYEYIYGAMGTFKINKVTNKVAVLEFEFTGVYGGKTDAAMVTPTYPTDAKLVCRGGPVTLDSVSLCLESAMFDIGNVVTGKPCSTKAQGYDFFFVSNRKPKITINPESKLVATQDRMGKYLAGTEEPYLYNIPAGTGKSFQIDAPTTQIIENNRGDREGVRTDEIVLQLNQNLGVMDSEFTLTFDTTA